MKFYLDFGHGGKDSGAVGFNGTFESNVVLKIGLILKSMLESHGHTVITTRIDDTYYSLSYRTNKANIRSNVKRDKNLVIDKLTSRLFCQSFSNLVKVVFHHVVVAIAFFTLFCDRVSKDLCVDWDVCVL